MPQQRLSQAVEALAIGADPIQQRLYWAAEYLVPLRRDDFAASEREEFVSIMDALTAVDPTGDEGSLRATTAALNDEDAVDIARRIVALDGIYCPLG